MAPRLQPRGGVAGGDSSNNPTQTTFDPLPPSSTYHGPTVAGSKGGFIGLITGLFFFLCLIALAIFIFLRFRRRSNGPTSRTTSAQNPSAGSRGWRRAAGEQQSGVDPEESDAFDMPSYASGQMGVSTPDFGGDDGDERARFEDAHLPKGKWLNPSTMSLDLDRRTGEGDYHGGSREYLGATAEEGAFRDEGREGSPNPFGDDQRVDQEDGHRHQRVPQGSP